MKNKPTTLTLFLICALWTGRRLSDFIIRTDFDLRYEIIVWISGIVGFFILITVSYSLEQRKDWIEKGVPRLGSIVFGLIQMALAVYFLLGLISFIREGFSTAYIGLPAIFLLVIRGFVKVWDSINNPREDSKRDRVESVLLL